MRISLIAAASTAAVLAAGLAASAHDAGPKARPSPASPVVKPAPKPEPAKAHCPFDHPVAHHERRAERAHHREFAHGGDRWGGRRDRWEGVSASQAYVYGREAERDRGFAGREFADRGAPPAMVPPPAGPPMHEHGFDHHAMGAEHHDSSSSHSYAMERRETDEGGFVHGERDGHAFGWSWGAKGCPCGPKQGDGREQHWRYGQGGGYEVYRYAGRDEDGYLVWPGKARPPG